MIYNIRNYQIAILKDQALANNIKLETANKAKIEIQQLNIQTLQITQQT